VLSETTENLLFEEAVLKEILDTPPTFDESWCWAIMDVLDPFTGPISLFIPKPLVARFAEGVLAVPAEEISQELLLDGLAETLNTLAGRLVARRLSADESYKLSLPATGVGEPILFAGESRYFHFLISDQFMFLQVTTALLKPRA
ncbi:MAG TPA: hypothetical protein PKO06_06465, partial [Candidatus Ozemobacteraceae bacterium]|nr:hypothetical protein [Candidatus Ozemobacteraceae bacterium]